MVLELNDSQFDKLVRLASIGDMIVNGNKTSEEADTEYQTVVDLLVQKAHSAGRKGFKIFPNEKTARPEQDYEIESYDFIDQYLSDTFWDILADQLADRDLEEEFGSDALDKMSEDELMAIRLEKADKYGEEFEKHGMGRIRIVKK